MAILVSVNIVSLTGCSSEGPIQKPIQEISDIKEGTPKNDIIQFLGKPENWIKVRPPGTTYDKVIFFDENAMMKNMPVDELWLFQYTLPNGNKCVIHFLDNKVKTVVEGALEKK
jgi:hypothetical protein